MGTSCKGKFDVITIHTKSKKDKNGKQFDKIIHKNIRKMNLEEKIFSKGGGITLTRKDMYNSKGECILPKGMFPKKYINRSKYIPAEEDKKHRLTNQSA